VSEQQPPTAAPAAPAIAPPAKPPARRRRLHFLVQYQGRKLADALEEKLPSYAVEYLRPALAGDEEAAESIMYAAPNEYRGLCALALYLNEAPVPCLRAGLMAAWNHDYEYVLQAFAHPKRRILKAAFRAAEIPIPELPPVVTIWRGGSRVTPSVLRRGLSWTLNRDVACWFAVGYMRAGEGPVVIRAEVPREAIVAYDDGRDEREVVVFGVRRAVVCGTPADWRAASARRSAKTTAEMKAGLAQYATAGEAVS
jgi:hypothetical protein